MGLKFKYTSWAPKKKKKVPQVDGGGAFTVGVYYTVAVVREYQ